VGLARVVVVTLALSAAASACSRGPDLPTPKPGFCEAAAKYDRRIERGASLDEQITILEKMERNAPDDIAEDATRFLESLRRLRDGDDSVVDNPLVEEAVTRVNRRAANGCDFFASEPGDGS
jgi:hypothetical protein